MVATNHMCLLNLNKLKLVTKITYCDFIYMKVQNSHICGDRKISGCLGLRKLWKFGELLITNSGFLIKVMKVLKLIS